MPKRGATLRARNRGVKESAQGACVVRQQAVLSPVLLQMNKTSGQPNLTFFWWVMWGALTAGATLLFVYFPTVRARAATAGAIVLPLLPLLAAIVVRWLWLPRISIPTRASPVFFLGLLLAAACGAMALVLVPSLRNVYAVLSVAGLLQYIPIFASKYYD